MSKDVNPTVATWIISAFVAGVILYYFTIFESSGSNSGSSDITMGGEFMSIKNCLSTFESKVGPLKITKDTPSEIFGRTSAGKMFVCQRVESGSRGTYYTGWYMTSK